MDSNTPAVKAAVIELEIASPATVATHASAELAAPIERTTALFAPFQKPFAAAAELLIQEPAANDASTARALRLKIVKARTEIGRTKDAAKADVKLVGQVIDWYHRKGAEQCEQAEARLLEIEKAEERAIAAQKEKLRAERFEQLRAVGVDGQYFPLGEMPAVAFDQLLSGATVAHAAKIEAEAKAKEAARIAAEKAEADRIAREKADAEERERVRVENELLKREAEAREVAARAEREKLQRELAESEAKARAERESAEKAAREEKRKADEAARIAAEQARRERAEIEAKAKAEREHAEKLAAAEREARQLAENALREKREAEEKRQREEVEAAARAAAAPDREKLIAFAELVRALDVPGMSTQQGRDAAHEIAGEIELLALRIHNLAQKMGRKAA